MKFKVGDIVGFDGKSDGKSDRIVLLVNHKKQEYSLGFTNDRFKIPYKWRMDHAHETYQFIAPSYIPKEQREKYRKLKCQMI
jgi:hypothetical protein